MNDKTKLNRFLTVDLNRLAYGAVCGLAAGVVAGAFSRLSMRAVALLIGQRPEFSIGGTVAILMIFGIAGIVFGWIFTGVSRYLLMSPTIGGWLYGALLLGLVAIPLFRVELDGELALVPPLTILAVFAPVFFSYGGVLGMASRKLQPWLAAATPRPVGIVSLILIDAFLFLGLMSIPSLGEFSLPFPRAIVRMYPILGLTYNTTHNLRGLLVFGFGLAYLGASGLIYLRSRRSWMGKFTAFALLAFAGAFFNSRDVIAAAFFGFPQAPILAGLLRAVGYSLFLLLLYIFPDGQFTPRWTLPLAVLFSVWGAVWSLDLWPNQPVSPASWPHALQLGVFFGSLGTGVIAQILRYRKNPLTDKALRWVVVSFVLAIGGAAAIWLLTLTNPAMRAFGSPRLPLTAVFAFAPYLAPWALIPLSIAFAVYRKRLWGDDRASANP
jgi:hypothetical protein